MCISFAGGAGTANKTSKRKGKGTVGDNAQPLTELGCRQTLHVREEQAAQHAAMSRQKLAKQKADKLEEQKAKEAKAAGRARRKRETPPKPEPIKWTPERLEQMHLQALRNNPQEYDHLNQPHRLQRMPSQAAPESESSERA